MSRCRWLTHAGLPTLLVAGALTAFGGAPPGARGMPHDEITGRATIGRQPTTPTTCVAPAAAGASAAGASAAGASRGAWWSTSPVLDGRGDLTGWSLKAGAPGRPALAVTIPAASVVSGPVVGLVLVSSDDGSRSEVRIVSTARSCSQTIPITEAVARRAIFDPAAEAIYVHLLDRGTRADRGVWRLAADGLEARTRVVAPLDPADPAAARIGIVWSTALELAPDGTHLAVQSCGRLECFTRVVDLASGAVVRYVDPHQGDLLAVEDGRIVTFEACPGLPCPVRLELPATAGRAGLTTTIAPSVTAAAPALLDGRLQLVIDTVDGDGSETMAIDPATLGRRSISAARLGILPIGARATAGLEVDPGRVALTFPTDDSPAVSGWSLDLPSGRILPAAEVSR